MILGCPVTLTWYFEGILFFIMGWHQQVQLDFKEELTLSELETSIFHRMPCLFSFWVLIFPLFSFLFDLTILIIFMVWLYLHFAMYSFLKIPSLFSEFCFSIN